MKAYVSRTSRKYTDEDEVLEINSLEDLFRLMKENDESLVLSLYGGDVIDDCDFHIEIYDDYRE